MARSANTCVTADGPRRPRVQPVDPALGRPMLHAAVLGFVHPATGAYTEFRAPLPADMESAVAQNRRAGVPGIVLPRRR